MNIAIDISPALNESAGIARYTRSITKEMLRLASHDQFCLFGTYIRGNQYKRQVANQITNQLHNIQRYRLPGLLKVYLWNTGISLPDRWCPNAEVLFAPSILEIPMGTKKKTVLTIHDMTTFLFPEQRGTKVSNQLNEITRLKVARADHIVAISSQTKADLVRFCKVPPEKVSVTLLAADPIFVPNPSVKKEQIILAVGTIEPRKNLDRLIAAYAVLPPDIIKQYKLVVVGGLGWQFDHVFKTLEKSNVKDRINFVGSVSDEELVNWYNKASVLVYPSLYEGFGLPPLEAMACGVPVITSNLSSLPEVVGKTAIMVNPTSVSEITKAIIQVLTHPSLAKKLSQAGLQQAKKFSWAKTAKQTLEIIHNV